MVEREPEVPEERRIRFRIGINLGDVIVEEHDIFGDGVNIAARLEGLAEPGGICLSRVGRDQVRDKVAFADMGEQSVKNIGRPVRVYAWRPEGIARVPASVSSTTSSSPPVRARCLSIVVLPFTNLSNDRGQQYFADGITEDLTTDRSRLRGNARDFAQYRVHLPEQAGRHKADRVRALCLLCTEGSVRRADNGVRVNAQLIDAESDTHSVRSGSTVTRAICSPCKTRLRAGSRLHSTLNWSPRKPPGRPSIPTRWTTFSRGATRRRTQDRVANTRRRVS
jgi:TolB-like protein